MREYPALMEPPKPEENQPALPLEPDPQVPPEKRELP